MVLFRLIFKVYPFDSVESAGVEDEKFFDNFINSGKNVYKVPAISDTLKTLLFRMLHRDNRLRCTMQEVLSSQWFQSMKDLLLSNPDACERTKQSLFTKLGYVVNVTKI